MGAVFIHLNSENLMLSYFMVQNLFEQQNVFLFWHRLLILNTSRFSKVSCSYIELCKISISTNLWYLLLQIMVSHEHHVTNRASLHAEMT